MFVGKVNVRIEKQTELQKFAKERQEGKRDQRQSDAFYQYDIGDCKDAVRNGSFND